jgi:hypothetical protein
MLMVVELKNYTCWAAIPWSTTSLQFLVLFSSFILTVKCVHKFIYSTLQPFSLPQFILQLQPIWL